MGRPRELSSSYKRGRIKLVERTKTGRKVIGFFNSYTKIAEYIEGKNWKNRVLYAVPKNIKRPMAIRRVNVDEFGTVYVEGYGHP